MASRRMPRLLDESAEPTASLKPTPREEFRTLVRQRIVTASLKCFEAGGYGASTMEAIAKEARISRTAIYQHFKYKSEILYEAVTEIEPLWRSTYLEAFPLHWDSPEKVRLGTVKMFEMYRRNISLLRVVHEAASIESTVSDWLESVFQQHVRDILDKMMGDRLKTPQARQHYYCRVWMAVTATDNVFQRVLDPRWSLDRQVAINEIARMWVNVMIDDDAALGLG